MPKEAIHGASDPYTPKIGWSRDAGDVQLGIEVVDAIEGTLLDLLLRSSAERIGESVRGLLLEIDLDSTNTGLGEAIIASISRDVVRYRGVWCDLDRSGVNHLIAVLRRARDQAFGKDE